MKLTPQIQKTIITVVVVGVLGYLGYYLYSSNAVPIDIIIPGESEPVGQDILVLAEQLNSITIDTDILSSDLFTRLRDLSVSIVPEPKGRANPFATIGVELPSTSLQPFTRVAGDSSANQVSPSQ